MTATLSNDLFAGRYRLVSMIGRGGFSEVWKAEDGMAENTVVAIKIYAPNGGLDDYGISQFRGEYVMTSGLNHPNLLRVHYFDIYKGSPYLVMPFFERGSLNRVIQERGGQLTETEVAAVLKDVSAALAYLHSQQPSILHQDIKPDNILVTADDRCILMDFGISTRTRNTLRKQTSSNTSTSLTAAYAPPERFLANPFSNPCSDIFSLGVMLYELCTGDVPWQGYGGITLLKGAPIPELPDTYSEELNKLMRYCLQQDASKRPSAEDIYKAASCYLQNKSWYVSPPAQKQAMLYKQSKPAASKRVLFACIAALGLGAIALGGYKKLYAPTGAAVEQVAVLPDTNQLEEYLNLLSDRNVAITTREGWVPAITSFFSDSLATIVDEQEGIVVEEYSVDQLISYLLKSPAHQTVKINYRRLDPANKITSLSIEITPVSPM